MNRRGFLRGLLAGTAVAALPIPVAKVAGQPVMAASGTISREAAKMAMFARAYGAGLQDIERMGAEKYGAANWQHFDFAEVEKRLLAMCPPSNRAISGL